jgi:acyl carrier protein
VTAAQHDLDVWHDLTVRVAAIAGVEPESLSPATGLTRDLALDSLAMAEVAVMMLEDFGIDLFAVVGFDGWDAATVGSLFDCLQQRRGESGTTLGRTVR